MDRYPKTKQETQNPVSDPRSCQSGGLLAVRFPTCITCDGTLLWMMLQVKELSPGHGNMVD